jgi:YegS/Rv2252/BmrU family lipid kinase
MHALIVNPSSGGGRGERLLSVAEQELRRRGLSFRIVVTKSLAHGVQEAVSAHEAGEIPVVMGGDGLIGQAGGALAGRKATMGILPGGRGNDLARVLGIPTEVPEAVDVLADGRARSIDVGEVNGHRFLCIASIGFDSVANRTANETRLIRGSPVYAYAALRTLASWKPAQFRVTLDGKETVEVTGWSVAVANSRAFGGGMFIAPDAQLDDGLFDVVMSGHTGKMKFLTNLPKVFKGTHVEEDAVNVRRAATVEVSADREFEVYADGEPLSRLPATLRVLERALTVIVPAAAAPDGPGP